MTKVINSFFLRDKSNKIHDKNAIIKKKSDKSDNFPYIFISVCPYILALGSTHRFTPMSAKEEFYNFVTCLVWT